MPRAFNLTPARLAILRRGVDHRNGVVAPAFHVGLEATSEKRNIRALEAAGFLDPNVHDDWYITDAGRAAWRQGAGHPTPQPRQCAICRKPGPGCFAFMESAIVARGGEPGNGYAHIGCFQRGKGGEMTESYSYEALAARLGDGWVEEANCVSRPNMRVWCYHNSSGRYCARFNNAGVSCVADAATPEQAITMALGEARRKALLTIEDIERISPGVAVTPAAERVRALMVGIESDLLPDVVRAAFNLQEPK